jgi:hypothetical protein
LKGGPSKPETDEFGLTEAQWAQLDALTGKPDTDDIPEANWATARCGVFAGRIEPGLYLHLDDGVLNWLRRKDEGAEAAIVRILRERMEAEALAHPQWRLNVAG